MFVNVNIQPLLVEMWEWSAKTFGPNKRTDGVINHIQKELDEVHKEPEDLEEWTDLVILSLDGFWRHCPNNTDKEQCVELLMKNLRKKLSKNQARNWPDWRLVPDNQAIEHVRTDDEKN